ncbi:MAG: hypothetical protein QF565_11600 [Arenicellales bacterium]|jgi:hypothetical protein|nr:hypothetical protein [Arenicellales bacterium]
MGDLLKYLGWLATTLCSALVVGQWADWLAALEGLETGLMFGLCASLAGGSVVFLVIFGIVRLAGVARTALYRRRGWHPSTTEPTASAPS